MYKRGKGEHQEESWREPTGKRWPEQSVRVGGRNENADFQEGGENRCQSGTVRRGSGVLSLGSLHEPGVGRSTGKKGEQSHPLLASRRRGRAECSEVLQLKGKVS